MPSNKSSKPLKSAKPVPSGLPPKILIASRALLLSALLISAYLAGIALAGGSVAGCGPDSGCHKVMQSRWAYWFGLPVTFPALLVYAGLFTSTFFIHPKTPPVLQRRAWMTMFTLSVAIALAAAWFVGLQLVVLKSFCWFCLTAHAAGFSAAALLWWHAPVRRGPKKAAHHASPIPPRLAARCELAGLFGLVLLISGQAFFEKSSFEVKAFGAGATREDRRLRLHDGKFDLNLAEVPMIGSPDAAHAIVSLFDYTCHYCRELHGLLRQTRETFGTQLAIVSLPMPLDADCNHLITRTQSTHENACNYARLALAVWRADRNAFATFDDWLFKPSSPPAIAQARTFAEQLVGAEKLNAALTDDWVRSQIQTAVGIYDANRAQTGNGRMPQLNIGAAISTGAINQLEKLHQLLETHLGLKANPAN